MASLAPVEDPKAAAREQALRQKFKDDFEFYAPRALQISPKEGSTIPLTLNKAQRYLHLIAEKQLLEKGRIRILVLKGRQQGISTYIEGRFYWKVTHRKGVNAFILTHEDKATQNLFKMAQRYHDNCLEYLKPSTGSDSAKTLDFKALGSGYTVGTAGTKAVGRSGTYQYFHGSEVAFWPHADTHSTGIIQTIPLVDNTEVFQESTGNGIGNYFHAQWQLAERGESDYLAVFLPWYWQDEYMLPCNEDFELRPEEFDLLQLFKKDGLTAEHLNWRRMKTMEFTAGGDDGEWKFKQEYPFTAAEAFQTSGDESLISPKHVLAARKNSKPMSGAHIVGVDPARFGKDRTAIIHRNGRKAYGLRTYKKKSTMEVAGICARILTDPVSGEPSDVDMMFIDVGGLGGGVYDRLAELGYEEDGRITAVDSGKRALEDDRYARKDAEMWVQMRDWFEMAGSVDIPDTDPVDGGGFAGDVIQGDICQRKFTYDSASRYVLERKEKMMERGLLSPDTGDALGLTFAAPVAPPNIKKRKARAGIKEVDYGV